MNKNYMQIGNRKIGEDYAQLVIAEIGINHEGSLKTAFEMVDAAYEAGAEVVKHQTHVVEDEMSKAAKKVIPGNTDVSIYDVMARCALNEEDETKLKEYVVKDAVKRSTCSEISHLEGDGFKVALMDFGAKRNIARSLNERGCDVTIYPAFTKAEEILAANPDGIMLSNGPGDPKECTSIIEELKKLYQSDTPIFAICLGHQLMALATGADTHKMKYGHRGANHPVKDLKSGRVYISSQNHGYVVDESTINPDIAEVGFINVNDKTIEGLRYKNKDIFTVQFHPEACPGPQDSNVLFNEFITMMENRRK